MILQVFSQLLQILLNTLTAVAIKVVRTLRVAYSGTHPRRITGSTMRAASSPIMAGAANYRADKNAVPKLAVLRVFYRTKIKI